MTGLLSVSVGIVRLAALGWLLGKIFEGIPLYELTFSFLLIAILMCARGLLEYSKNIVAHHTASKIQKTLRGILFDKLMRLGPGYITHQRSGELALTLVDGIEQLETYFGRYLPQVLISAITPLIIFCVVCFIDLPVALILLFAALVALLGPSLWHQLDSRRSLERSVAYGEFAAEFLDSIQGLATLKSFGQSESKAKLLSIKAKELFRTTMWVLATNSLARGITDTSIALGAASALIVGSIRVIGGNMELNALLIILLLGVEIFRPMRELRSVLHQGMVGRSAAIGVYRIFDAKPEVTERSNSPERKIQDSSIHFCDVGFQYPGKREKVHSELSFIVNQGERVGIVGPSGSGKSTIVRLIERFHEVSDGSIRIGDIDIRQLPLNILRQNISVVYQDAFLFHGTVRENLQIGKFDATDQELDDATKKANIYQFIMDLPNGYDTLIGERGIKLSGGQKQRVAIARALLRDAPILILDEALSSVDAENEAIILDALDKLMVGRTTIVLAHRLSSIIKCDQILVLADGNIKEKGTHLELIRSGQFYKSLMADQLGLIDKAQLCLKRERIPREDRVFKDATLQPDTGLPPTEGVVRAEGLSWSQTILILLRHVIPWKAKASFVFICGILRVLTYIGIGIFSALIVWALKSEQSFQPFVIGLCFSATFTGILHWLESWLAHDMAFRLLADLRIAAFRKIDRLAPAYLTRRRTGDIMSIATQDIEMIEYFFAHTIAPALVSILVPGAVLGILLSQNIWLGLSILPFLILVSASPFLMRKRLDDLGSKAKEASGELTAYVIDSIQGMTEILSFQNEVRRQEKLNVLAQNHISLRLPFYRQLVFQEAALDTLTGLGGLAIVVTGTILVQSNNIDAGALPLLTILAMAAFLPISEIAEIGRQLADTLGATRRLYGLENEPETIKDGPGLNFHTREQTIQIKGVSFWYPGGKAIVLDNISSKIEAGKTVAIVGPSGSGKTTLANLLMRFWDPTNGVIVFGNHDLRQYRLDELRQKLALVSQDTYLFNDTLEANIRIAKPNASKTELYRAIEYSALESLITALPLGLETNVGERGTSLSGGQRQRVAIARAFLKNAPVLILDEATSHLDTLSEQVVHQSLSKLQANRTTLVIAHRLSTIQEADRILVMDKGQIVESGSHEELLRDQGLYTNLVNHQMVKDD